MGRRSGTWALRDPSVLSITVTGFAATIAQVVLLRELLVLFHGNEMSTALALAGWLLWTSLGSALAARRSDRCRPRVTTIALLLALLAVALPALVLVVRGARVLLAVPAGELLPVSGMLLVCLSVPALLGPAAGALFGLCWAYRRAAGAGGSWARPLAVYLGEAVGAAAGGLVFYFVLLRATTALSTVVAVALMALGVSGWLLRRQLPPPLRGRFRQSRAASLLWSLAALAVVVAFVGGDRLEQLSRRWQWGTQPALTRDTPFHNIVILRQPGQVTVFTNGLWLFTLPDPASSEPAVHTALLLHPRPRRVLLIGGGLGGQVGEVLEHPTIEAVDYVEPDPELIRASAGFMSRPERESLRDRRLRVHNEDATAFLRRAGRRYDVILMSTGDPINAQMNRLFTVEMYRRVAARLLPTGILTFSVPGGGDMFGPAHTRYLSSMRRTLRQVFPEVVLLPGESARFFASREAGSVVLDPAVLGERLRDRQLDLAHLREDVLQDLLSPLRLEYAQSLLDELESSPVNREFSPICYVHALRLWAAQWHPGLERLLGWAAALRPRTLTAGLAVLGALVVLFFWLGRPRYRTAVRVSVFVQGGVAMVLQVVLILTFQILEGFAYLQLALIIALFMAGLAAGTAWVAAGGWREDEPERDRAVRWFAWLQLGVTLFPLLLLAFFAPPAAAMREALSAAATSWVFSVTSFLAGVLGGAHFSLAALACRATGGRSGSAGGVLYAADLAGAAGGALAAGLVVLPLYGVPSTLFLLGLASLVCLLAILRRPRLRSAIPTGRR